MELPAATTDFVRGMRVALHRHVDGSAEPVLLLHGGGLDRASLSWRHLFPALAQTRRVIAPDWPGYGDSEGLGGAHTLDDLGHWLVALLDELALERVDLVGVSMGGGAALWLALNHPRRVGRVVAVDAYGLQERAPFHFWSYLMTRMPLGAWSGAVLRRSRWATRHALGQIFSDPARVKEALVDEVLEVLRSGNGLSTFGQFQRGEIGPRKLHTVLTPKLDRIQSETLIVHGLCDRLVPVCDARRAAASMPCAKLSTMYAGHWPMRERPEEFNEIVLDFLGRPDLHC